MKSNLERNSRCLVPGSATSDPKPQCVTTTWRWKQLNQRIIFSLASFQVTHASVFVNQWKMEPRDWTGRLNNYSRLRVCNTTTAINRPHQKNLSKKNKMNNREDISLQVQH